MLRRLWPVALVLVGLVAVWAVGGFSHLSTWAAEGQRDFQNAMARSLRALRGGQPGAFGALMSVCFAYGFFHAVGPGHGKVLIGGYGLGTRRKMGALAGLAVASSLAQATTAVIFAYGAIWTLEWTRQQIVDTTERMMAPLSYTLIACVGLWLLIRGLRRGFKSVSHAHHPHAHDHHHHDHGEGEVCSECGHKHAPTVEDLDKIHSLRDALVLIGAIAIRPCTGALFVLILTWQMEIAWQGVAGAYAMGLGTASVTVGIAIGAVWFRDRASLSVMDAGVARRIGAGLEVLAGLIVIAVALRLLMPFL
ncbi:nickel/cobalt transporter [Actibacterium pelagium]|uniref:Nickel/cobalt efflux system n=1 Tax=Actibacterium pelagium TaxID=2029103 RepID=A0A917AAW1_9RHOB|nr:hypothetical protein [Actibacterium pelagium]GGE38976.1 nickel/cobalt efflux system [Actibacterium pelagium]